MATNAADITLAPEEGIQKKERQISRAKPTLDLGQFSGPKSMTN